MTVERGVRLMAGVMVLLSLALAHYCLALLAVADGFRRTQPAAIGFYQLVPGDDYVARCRIERCQLQSQELRLRWMPRISRHPRLQVRQSLTTALAAPAEVIGVPRESLMTVRKGVPRLARPRQLRGERLKDEVYRQMFRLEERRSGAEIGLALALLRAWLAANSKPASDEEKDWLKKVSPICLEMIEVALRESSTSPPCVQ